MFMKSIIRFIFEFFCSSRVHLYLQFNLSTTFIYSMHTFLHYNIGWFVSFVILQAHFHNLSVFYSLPRANIK